VLSAIVLARDVRLVESFWVYPQADLMTFFRSVATDLRDETPMFLVGFAASPPARDTLRPRRCTAADWTGSTTTTGRPRTSSRCARRSAPITCTCSRARELARLGDRAAHAPQPASRTSSSS
jgi:hypothetical protein